jgi:hypothetical protein
MEREGNLTLAYFFTSEKQLKNCAMRIHGEVPGTPLGIRRFAAFFVF